MASLLAALTLIFSACEKDNTEATPNASLSKTTEEPTMKRLLAMGFAPQNIVDKGDYYLVEGDISFDKQKSVPVTPTAPGVIVQSQDQAHTYELIRYDRQPNVTIRIDASFPAQWQGDVVDAVNDWNAIEGSRVDLTLTTSNTADITIRGVPSLENDAFGKSEFPSNGAPGYQVLINFNNSPDTRRRTTIVHEIGHCMGLRHTNLYARGEGASDIGGVFITGTPSEDPNSVMNSGDQPNRQIAGWQGFSQFDVIAFQNLYPVFAATAPAGLYKIVAQHSGKVLDVRGGSQNNQAPIIQYYYKGVANQQWSFGNAGDDHYTIVARHSGKVLSVDGARLNNEVTLVQYQYENHPNQQWRLQDVGGGRYKIIARHSGKSISVYQARTGDDVSIIQFQYEGNPNQQWTLEPI